MFLFGFVGIKSSLTITKSPSGAFGPGVYLTDLSPPKYDKSGISLDIFGGRIPGRVRYAIEVRLPDSKLVHHDVKRHIWTFSEDVTTIVCSQLIEAIILADHV